VTAVPWRRPSTRHGHADSLMDTWTRAADEVTLPRIDESEVHPRPAGISVTYAEQEYDALADEQGAAWSADGERAARPFQVQGRGHDVAAAADLFLLAEHEQEVLAAHADHQHAVRVLQPYVRREPGAKLRYWICWVLLVLGDTSGVLSAAIMLGDIPLVAAGQALSSGLAAACAGLVGSELKHLQLAKARRRDTETLSADEQRYRHLFAGPAGTGIVKLIGALSVLVVLLVGVAIATLRNVTEGSEAGLTFGLLAAITAMGSALLGYAAADEVADLLATTARRVRKAEARHRALAKTTALRVRAEADETARSLHVEYEHRGQAASNRVESLSWRILRRNPQVMGHGLPNGDATGIVGRRARRGGRP
jgi:hypothetical protein